MQYLINSASFLPGFIPNPDKNFDLQFKDEDTISILMTDENVEEVTEFIVAPKEPWFLPFKVGPFIEKRPNPCSFIKNCVLVKYYRHPEQVGSIMRSQAWEQGLKDAKKHKMPKRRR